MKKIIVGIAVFAIGLCSATLGAGVAEFAPNREITGAYDKSAAAVCENGTFVGERRGDVIAYRGVPYAQQPVGKLRWKAPLAPLPSDKVYEAFHFGKSCLQVIDHAEKASLYEQGEDCLTLCVYRNAADPETRKPVLVFIHGGGYTLGGTSDPTYDGINFVTQNPDAILVVMTYRFGMMGYANFRQMPDGGEYRDAVNLGQLDQIAALKWVKRNIAAFGGDPDRIAICGESAGGGSVSSLVLSPEARKYFRRAIPMSGVANYGQDRNAGQSLTEALKKRFGAKTVADLVKVDTAELVKFWREEGLRYYNFPTRDGVILPEDPIMAWTDPALKDIEVMQGVTRNEWRYFIAVFGYDVAFFKDLNRHFYDLLADGASAEYRADAERLLKVLEGTYGKDWALAEFISGHVFRAGQMFQALSHARNGGKEFFYRIDKTNSGECHELRGADHGVELPYLFGNLGDEDAPDTEANRRYAHMLQRMWVNFAKTGNPSVEGIEWPAFDDMTRKVMVLGEDGAHVEENPEAERTELEQRLIAENPKFKYCAGLSPVLARMFEVEGTGRFDAIMRKNAELAAEFQNKSDVVPPADTVVYGTIRTAEEAAPVVEAFAVKDGKFVYVGDRAGAAAFVKDGVTRVVDHRGKGMVMPSCTDGHAHYILPLTLASMNGCAMFKHEDDKAEVLRKLEAAASAARKEGKKSVFGFGWNYYTIMPDKPTLAELDAATRGVSAVIFDSSGHNAFGNSECLR
ncbi:MAG: carboxylesterase family protein, partial [Victivallaceae bacterium]|nr:carboxylesterase family protein [Victivallaceae bacterium]